MDIAALAEQSPYRIRFDRGREGLRRAAARGDIIGVVDVLSFSSAAVTALAHGVQLLPCATREEAPALAQRHGAQLPGSRDQGGPSLSPRSWRSVAPGMRYILPSPNGATCCALGGAAPALIVGALLNASAAASALRTLAERHDRPITVIACGERWPAPGEDGALRSALEDDLGAGAILAMLGGERSPEAEACALLFDACRERLADLLWDSISGRELRERGWPDDVRFCSQLDIYTTVPRLVDGWLRPHP